MEKPNYATVITTVAVALLLLFFTTISAQIGALESRLRSVEQQLTAISTSLGIRQPGLTSSQQGRSGAAVASPLEDQP